jgi:hypothetical protein
MTSPCGDKIVKISTMSADGAVPETVILCPGDRVTWVIEDPAKVKEFRIDIEDDPFEDNGPFHSKKPTSGKAKAPHPSQRHRFFKYTITVSDPDGKTLPAFDPHGIILGGP